MLVLGFLLVMFVAIILYGNSGRRGGPASSFPSLEVDETLLPHVFMEITGYGGVFNLVHYEGSINWRDSLQDSVKSVENLHLVLFTEVFGEQTFGDEIVQGFEIRMELCRNEFQVSENVIDFDEVVIPVLGLDNPSFEFSLTCFKESP